MPIEKPDIPREVDCKRRSAQLNQLLPHAFEYARRKRLIDRWFRAYDALEPEWERYPEGWEDSVRGMLANAALFGSRERAAAFCRVMKKELPDELTSMARCWRERPWCYIAFTVIADYGDNLLEIVPLGDPPSSWLPAGSNGSQQAERVREQWQSLLLYSPSVGDHYRHGIKLFLTQLWDDGRAFQTYGVVLPFRSLEPEDLLFFADVARFATQHPGGPEYPRLAGVVGRTTNLSDVIAANPLAFLQLIRFSDAPGVAGRGVPLRRCAASAVLSEPAAAMDEADWALSLKAAGEHLALAIFDDDAGALYPGEASPMHDPALYLSYSDDRCYLAAMSEEAYRRGRDAVAAVCVFPEEPEVRASMVAYAAAHKILDCADELRQLEDRFSARRAEGEFEGEFDEEALEDEDNLDDASLPSGDELQAILNRLSENHNEGRTESDEEIAAALGVDPAKVTPLSEKLSAMFEEPFGPATPDTPGGPASGAADRFGLSPKAYVALTRRSVPDVPGALVVRNAAGIAAALRARGLDPECSVADAPAVSFARWFINKAVAEGSVAATQAGYVATKVVAEAFERHVIPPPFESAAGWDRYRPKKEGDWPEFQLYRKLLEAAGLVDYNGKRFVAADTPARASAGRLSVAELAAGPLILYHHLLEEMFLRFEWDYHPWLPAVPHLRESAGFLFYAAGVLQRETADWIPASRLTERFIAAVPPLAAAVAREREQLRQRGARYDDSARDAFGLPELIGAAVSAHFIGDFAESFGLLETQYSPDSGRRFRTTRLYAAVFGETH